MKKHLNKLMWGNALKKAIGALTTAAVLVSSFAMPFASAADTASGDPVHLFMDFENGNSWHNTDAPVADTGNSEHGKAAKYGLNSYLKTDGETQTAVTARFSELAYGNFAPTGKYIISYDVMLTSNLQSYRFMLRDSNSKDFAFIDFTNDNRIITGKTGSGTEVGRKGADYTDSTTLCDCARYAENQWNNISIVVNPKDNGGSQIAYYLDGKLISTADASGKNTSNGKATKMYLGAYKTLDENGNIQYPTDTYMWIDNYCVQYADSAYYTSFTNSQPQVSGGVISVDFIEPICTDGYSMSDIKLYGSDNNEVSGATANVSGKTLTITGATLTSGVEYHIALPAAFCGVSGVKPQMDVISFTNGETAKTSGEIAWVTQQEFTGNTNGFIAQNNSILNTKLADDNYIVTFSQSASTSDQWQAAVSDLETVVPSGCSFLDKDYNLSNELVLSSDYYFPSENTAITGTGAITTKFERYNAQIMRYQFKSDNKICIQSMDESSKWIEAYSAEILPNTWYTVKGVVNKEKKYIDYYLTKKGESESYIGTTYFNTSIIPEDAGTTTSIRTIYGHLSGDSTSGWIPGNYYIDNMKAGYILDTEYNKVVDSCDTEVTSYSLADGKSVRTDKSYMLSFNITPANLSEDGVEFRVNGSSNNRNIIFKMYKDGTLKMSNGSIGDWNNSYTYTLPVSGIKDGEKFNIKICFDKDVKFSSTANERRRCAYMYIDNKFVRAFALGNGNETGDYPGMTETDITNLLFTSVTGSANAKISNFKIGYTSKIPYIESAVIYNQNDETGRAFVSQNIKSDIDKIVLNVADTTYATNGELTAGTAKLTKGTDTIELEAAVSGSQIVLTAKDGAYVPNGTWTLTYTGSADCGDYTSEFTVNEARTLIDNSALKVTGSKATLEGTIQNFTESRNVSVIIAEYSAENPKRLVNLFAKDITLQSGVNTLSGLELTGSTQDSGNYKAFIWQTVSDMVPVFSAKTAE